MKQAYLTILLVFNVIAVNATGVSISVNVYDKNHIAIPQCEISISNDKASAYEVKYDSIDQAYHIFYYGGERIINIKVSCKQYETQERSLNVSEDACFQLQRKVIFCLGEVNDHYVWNHCYFKPYSYNPYIIAIKPIQKDSIFLNTTFFPYLKSLGLEVNQKLTDSLITVQEANSDNSYKNHLFGTYIISRKDNKPFKSSDEKILASLRKSKLCVIAGPVLWKNGVVVSNELNVTIFTGADVSSRLFAYVKANKGMRAELTHEGLGSYIIYFDDDMGEEMLKHLKALRDKGIIKDYDTYFINSIE